MPAFLFPMQNLKTAILHYSEAKPHLIPIMSFCNSIFDVQRQFIERITPGLCLSQDSIQERLSDGLPIFAGEELTIQPDIFRELTKSIACIYQDSKRDEGAKQLFAERSGEAKRPFRENKQEEINALLESDEFKDNNVQIFVENLIHHQEESLSNLASKTGLDKESLFSLFRIILIPFYEKNAEPFRDKIDETQWYRGFCPICGALPLMGKLRQEDGKRILICSLCRTEWTFPRLQCPFCHNADQKHLRYFYIEEEPTYRVNICEVCKGYIKTVDEKILGREAVLLVEDIVTFQLDILAEEEGYTKSGLQR